MITIISGTNRQGSQTRRVTEIYRNIFKSLNTEVNVVDLASVDVTTKSDAFLALQEEILVPTTKYVIIAPEYNGSFPGILKLMIDNSDIKRTMWHKKAMLVGVAEGRAGNLRGMDHLTNILNYLKIQVLPNKIPLSRISTELTADGAFVNEGTHQTSVQQVQEFIAF
ncbi:MAG: hypothetical protein RL660_538 [Bacteroidota bacterium]|jgi:NAD(P)H-dependent FMN reductase